jgi:hypothetical protein
MSYRNEPAPSLNLRPIRRKARRRGLKAGRAEARGRPHADRLEDLPGRIWVAHRFEQHIKAIETDELMKKRYHQQELRVLRTRVEELDLVVTRHESVVAKLTPLREEDRAKPRVQQDLDLESELRIATAAAEAKRAERHEHHVEAERHQSKVEALESAEQAWPDRERESRNAVLQEHDLAFRASAQSAFHAFLGKLIHPFTRAKRDRSGASAVRSAPVLGESKGAES